MLQYVTKSEGLCHITVQLQQCCVSSLVAQWKAFVVQHFEYVYLSCVCQQSVHTALKHCTMFAQSLPQSNHVVDIARRLEVIALRLLTSTWHCRVSQKFHLPKAHPDGTTFPRGVVAPHVLGIFAMWWGVWDGRPVWLSPWKRTLRMMWCVCVCERPLQGNDKCLMLMNASPLHTEKIEK